MKIRCDVCDKEEASVFCSADEAALCDVCDGRVHHANKLASKHLRFSLVNPSFKDFPLCDICQERRALLFCQEDRAILCRDCDIPIHKANEYTKKHNRFLLTGVKFSASSSLYPTSSSSNCCDATTTTTSSSKTISVSNNEIFSSHSIPSTPYKFEDNNHISDNCSVSTSSISEYLMETLPGWCVEDFLDPSSSAASDVMCNVCSALYLYTSDKFLSFGNQDLKEDHSAILVPEVFVQSPQVLHCIVPKMASQMDYSRSQQKQTARNFAENGVMMASQFLTSSAALNHSKKPRHS